MAGLLQQSCLLKQDRPMALLLFICLLSPASHALPSNTKGSSFSLEEFEVVKGVFSHSFLHVGYHKITEIPAGACNISIQETKKSRNYLALQTQSGISIINGNWVIDRPGTYIALGTQLTYRRPNEIRSRSGESITAPGPLTEDLHLYLIYQQPSPGVEYEYSIPLSTRPTPEPGTPSPILPLDTPVNEEEFNNNYIMETPHPKQVSSDSSGNSEPTSTHIWTKSGHTECSTTCGAGKRPVLWECTERYSQMIVPADLCDPATEPTNQEEDCNKQPCPAYWDIGEWSECSRRCGPGTQQRQVICRQVTHVDVSGSETSVTVAPELCGSSDRPETKSICQLKICSQWEIRSEWSPE
ncbi:thrombospondin type-1 domain-containing protein 4-like [Cololabis saira]|uniref:thrombospondin type-1 domain-containing protein 4-like n=1 Tax=Cololabis saira TaxID=129043 RepID=UPI002AD56E22|nr:thrombospondin type-1 domain-containing protein 4-like [Cololabis saira]